MLPKNNGGFLPPNSFSLQITKEIKSHTCRQLNSNLNSSVFLISSKSYGSNFLINDSLLFIKSLVNEFSLDEMSDKYLSL